VADPTDDPSSERLKRLRADPEARLEFLLERDLLVERDVGTIEPTSAFEDERAVYLDTYGDCSDERFRETVAELFGLTTEAAAERIEALELERWDLATFLAVRAALAADLPRDVVLELSAIVAETGRASPVPRDLRELADGDFESFVKEAGAAVVFVFQRGCDPCDAQKADLDEVRARAPEGVAFAGVDGDSAPEFRRAFEVTVAPTVLLFFDGDLAATAEGYQSPETLDATFAETFPAADG
jgi:thiol-disulfide isomerase/thioredoxin